MKVDRRAARKIIAKYMPGFPFDNQQDDSVTIARRKLSLHFHPDRAAGDSEKAKEMEEKIKVINTALDVLEDTKPAKRSSKKKTPRKKPVRRRPVKQDDDETNLWELLNLLREQSRRDEFEFHRMQEHHDMILQFILFIGISFIVLMSLAIALKPPASYTIKEKVEVGEIHDTNAR